MDSSINQEKAVRAKTLIALHLLLIVYSCSGILSKVASSHPFLSMGFIAAYVGIIGLLGIYAICWQQIIKRIPLTTAYANRAVTVVWGMVWGVLVFKESLTPLQVIGGLIVLVGVAVYALADGPTSSIKHPSHGGADK